MENKNVQKWLRKLASLALVAVMVFALLPGGILPVKAAMEGEGTEANPYLIKTEEDLRTLCGKDIANNKHYKLANDIALTSDWTPIKSLNGTIDGDGHKITGLKIGSAEEPASIDNAGFIASISGGTVKNLHLDVAIYTTTTNNSFVGGVAGVFTKGLIDGCTVSGTVSGTLTASSNVAHIGGIVGRISGVANGTITIKDCFNSATVTAKNTQVRYAMAGGIVGHAQHNSTTSGQATSKIYIYNCGNVGTLNAVRTGDWTGTDATKNLGTGGIVANLIGGYAADTAETVIKNCYNAGSLNATQMYGAVYYNGGGRVYTSENLFCLTDQSVQTAYAGTTQKDLADMQTAAFAKTLNEKVAELNENAPAGTTYQYWYLPTTENATPKLGAVQFDQFNMTLHSALDVNWSLTDAKADDDLKKYTVEITIGGVAQEVQTKENGRRYASLYFYDANKEFVATLKYGDVVIDTSTKNLVTYKDGQNEKTLAVLNALETYALCGRIYAKGSEETAPDLSAVTVPENLIITGNPEGVRAGLVLDDDCDVKIRIPKAYGEYTLDETLVNTLPASGEYYLYEKNAIAIDKWATNIVLTLTKEGENNVVITYDPLSYVAKRVNDATLSAEDAELTNLAKAMYQFYTSVEAYNAK